MAAGATGRSAALLVLHALVVWALCGATIAVGRAWLPTQTATLVLHAILAPVFAAAAAWAYSKRSGGARPLATAGGFLTVIAAMDVFVVAPLFERSFDMFRSALGTWIPFASIFVAAWLAARVTRRRPARPAAAPPAPGAASSRGSGAASSYRS